MINRYTAIVNVKDPRDGAREQFASALVSVAAMHRAVIGRPSVRAGFSSFTLTVQVNGRHRGQAFDRVTSLVGAIAALAPARLMLLEQVVGEVTSFTAGESTSA